MENLKSEAEIIALVENRVQEYGEDDPRSHQLKKLLELLRELGCLETDEKSESVAEGSQADAPPLVGHIVHTHSNSSKK